MQIGTPKPEAKPATMRWDGTEGRAYEIRDWARDAALLPYASITPPDRNAAEGTPEATWRLKLKAEVAAAMGGGWEWIDVPHGSLIRFTGTEEDPTFSVRSPRAAAQALTNE